MGGRSVWIKLDETELALVEDIQRRIVKAKRVNRDQSGSSDPLEIGIMGFKAEAALARYLSIPISWQLLEGRGDGGVDLEIAGRTTQIKATRYPRSQFVFFLDGSGFGKDLGEINVLARVDGVIGDPWVELLGWATRLDFAHYGTFQDFGHGPRWTIPYEVRLRSMSKLLELHQRYEEALEEYAREAPKAGRELELALLKAAAVSGNETTLH